MWAVVQPGVMEIETEIEMQMEMNLLMVSRVDNAN